MTATTAAEFTLTTTHVGVRTGLYNTRHDSGTITTSRAAYDWQVTYRITDKALGVEHAEHIYLTAARKHVGSGYFQGRTLGSEVLRRLRADGWVVSVPLGVYADFDGTEWAALTEIVRRHEATPVAAPAIVRWDAR